MSVMRGTAAAAGWVRVGTCRVRGVLVLHTVPLGQQLAQQFGEGLEEQLGCSVQTPKASQAAFMLRTVCWTLEATPGDDACLGEAVGGGECRSLCGGMTLG